MVLTLTVPILSIYFSRLCIQACLHFYYACRSSEYGNRISDLSVARNPALPEVQINKIGAMNVVCLSLILFRYRKLFGLCMYSALTISNSLQELSLTIRLLTK